MFIIDDNARFVVTAYSGVLAAGNIAGRDHKGFGLCSSFVTASVFCTFVTIIHR